MNNKLTIYIPDQAMPVVGCMASVILLLPSVIFFTQQPIVGAILLFVYITIVTYKSGYEFDFTNKTIKPFNRLLFYKFGEWKSYKNCISYSYLKHKNTYRLNSRGSSTQQSNVVYNFELFDNENKPFLLIKGIKINDLKALVLYMEKSGLKKLP